MNDFELRWLVQPGTTTTPPRLQWRELAFFGYDELDRARYHWSEWRDIPTEVASADEGAHP